MKTIQTPNPNICIVVGDGIWVTIKGMSERMDISDYEILAQSGIAKSTIEWLKVMDQMLTAHIEEVQKWEEMQNASW